MNNDELARLLPLEIAIFPVTCFANKAASQYVSESGVPTIAGIRCVKGNERKWMLEINSLALLGNHEAEIFMSRFFLEFHNSFFVPFAYEYLYKGYEGGSLTCALALARLYEERSLFEKAKEIRKKFLLSGNDFEAEVLIKRLIEENRLDEALFYLKKWEEIAPSDPTMLSYYAHLQKEIGNYGEAIALYKRNEGYFEYELGYLSFYGLGCPKDEKAAYLHFRKGLSMKELEHGSFFPLNLSDLYLAKAHHEGVVLEKSQAKSDFYLEHYLRRLPKDHELLERRNLPKIFAETGYLARRNEKYLALMKEGKKDPYKYLEAAYIHKGFLDTYHSVRDRRKGLTLASRNGVKEAYYEIAYAFPKYDNGMRKDYYEECLQKAKEYGYKDIEEELPSLMTPQSRESFLLSLSNHNLIENIAKVFEVANGDESLPLLNRAARISLKMSDEHFRFVDWRSKMAFGLIKEEIAASLYQRLCFTSYGLYHNEELDKKFGVDPERLLLQDLFGR